MLPIETGNKFTNLLIAHKHLLLSSSQNKVLGAAKETAATSNTVLILQWILLIPLPHATYNSSKPTIYIFLFNNLHISLACLCETYCKCKEINILTGRKLNYMLLQCLWWENLCKKKLKIWADLGDQKFSYNSDQGKYFLVLTLIFSWKLPELIFLVC